MLRKLLYLGLFTIVPGMLLRIGLGGAGVLPLDVLGAGFFFLWFFRALLVDKRFPAWGALVPGAVFLLWAFLTWVYGVPNLLIKEQVLAFSYLLRFAFGLSVGAFLYEESLAGRIKNIENKIIYLAFTLGIIGILQFYFFPNLGAFSSKGAWDPHIGRLFSTWLDPNFIGGFFGLMIPVALAKYWDEQNPKQKALWGFISLILVYALWLTFSRSGYLAAGLGALFFLFHRKKSVILIGVLLFSLGVAGSDRAQQRLGSLMGTFRAVILQQTDEIDPTANLRILSWQNSLELWQTSPIMGIGYNAYRAKGAQAGIVQATDHNAGGSDSTLLTVLVTTGVFGFLLFFWFIFALWWPNVWAWYSRVSTLHLGLASGMVSLFIHSFFVNSMLYPFIFVPLMAMTGGIAGKRVDKY